MVKKILYSIICFVVFASCLFPLVSCGGKMEGADISAYISNSEYFEEGDYSCATVGVNVTNRTEGQLLTACSVKLYFKDDVGHTVDTKIATFTNLNVETDERETFYEVYNVEDGYGTLNGKVTYVNAEPYSITLEKVSGEVGSFWSIAGIIGAIIGVVFVGGVIYGLFFD